jgi:hypothetical protein
MRLSCESLVVRGMCWHHWFCFQVRDSNELAAEEKTFLNFTVPRECSSFPNMASYMKSFMEKFLLTG